MHVTNLKSSGKTAALSVKANNAITTETLLFIATIFCLYL
jgi:hypothetical protein